MPCILPQKAEQLKKAFQTGAIGFDMLYKAGSTQVRIKILEKYVGESAKELNTKIERVYLSANQKLAARNVFYSEIAQKKPLYKGISLEQAQKMADEINIYEFKNKIETERLSILQKYLDKDTAKQVNKRFEIAKKTGQLSNWEERTIGTKELRENKKLKGALAKLEVLDELGVLSPKQLENFMEGIIEEELGITLTLEESQKLSQIIKEVNGKFDKLYESDNWTFENKEQMLDYFTSLKKLHDYSNELENTSVNETVNQTIGVFRNNLLGSPKSLLNSFFYGVLPSIERTITRRLVSGEIGNKDLDASFLDKIITKFSASRPSKEALDFVSEQIKLAIEIYHKTGFDISRMETLNDFDIFGGEKFRTEGNYRKWKESKGVKNKIKTTLYNYAKFTNFFPKWFAGGTDMVLANFHKADTSILFSKERALLEERKGKLPNGMTVEQRAKQLLIDSYSFNPKDENAQRIREAGIFDAHKANSTQKDGLSDTAIKVRDAFKIKGIDIGKVFVPFAKIAATTVSVGAKTASGFGVAQSIYRIVKAGQLSDNTERTKQFYRASTELVSYLGIYGAALFLSAFLDDDDYIGSWFSLSTKEYSLAKAQAGGSGYIRIGSKWIPLKFLPILSIPLAAIMQLRQARAKGKNALLGYVSGIASGIMEVPGLSEINKQVDKIIDLAKVSETKNLLNQLGLDKEFFYNWVRVRVLPAALSRDMWNLVNPPDKKYDFLGREIQRGSYWKDDNSNSIIIEFNRLNNEGVMPTISDPKDIPEKKLNEYKRKYAERVSNLIKQEYYKKMTLKNKKKAIDKIRQKEILDKKD